MPLRKINLGMVGGGPGSFIGKIHFHAAMLDGQIQLVCGAFSSDPAKSKETGTGYYLPDERIYATYQEMIAGEALLPDEERMDILCIATPNHLHYEPAKLALENGFHVICDKPLAFSLEEAEELAMLADKTGLIFAVTHAYAAYPMVKEARHLVASGALGTVRKVVAEYPQGWLSDPIEKDNHIQASWRTDPKRTGKSGCMGDIGTHALHLAEYSSGLKVNQLCADLSTMVEGRAVDDDGNVLLRFNNAARGVLYASQVSAGEENGLRIRVYGEKGGIDWIQADPGKLVVRWLDRPMEVRTSGNTYLSKEAQYSSRMPAGHPEGLIEAFANIYRNVATCIQHRLENEVPPEEVIDFPDVKDGLRGMQFIQKVVESSVSEHKWIRF